MARYQFSDREQEKDLSLELRTNGVTDSGVLFANKLNDDFIAAGTYLASVNTNLTRTIDSYLPSCSADSMFLSPTSTDEVSRIIIAFRHTYSPGADEIVVYLMKCVFNIVAGPLAHICNRTLLTGVFPDKLEVARVTILFKGGSKHAPSNYHPISVLQIISKVAERILLID